MQQGSCVDMFQGTIQHSSSSDRGVVCDSSVGGVPVAPWGFPAVTGAVPAVPDGAAYQHPVRKGLVQQGARVDMLQGRIQHSGSSSREEWFVEDAIAAGMMTGRETGGLALSTMQVPAVTDGAAYHNPVSGLYRGHV